MSIYPKLVIFDGDCAFCNRSVQFIIKRNKKKDIFFASNSSELAKDFQNFDLNSSILYVENGKAFQKSTAALKIAKSFSGLSKLFLLFWIIPRPIRDFGYDLIAKYRKRIIKDKCGLFSPEEQKQIIS